MSIWASIIQAASLSISNQERAKMFICAPARARNMYILRCFTACLFRDEKSLADLKEDASRRGGSHEMIVRPRLYKIDDNCAALSHHTLAFFAVAIYQWQFSGGNFHLEIIILINLG